MSNPITEEIRAIRRKLAERFDNDLDRIVGDLQRRQGKTGRRLVALPKRTSTPPIALGGEASVTPGTPSVR